MFGIIALAAGITAGSVVTRMGAYTGLRESIAPTTEGFGLDDIIDILVIAGIAAFVAKAVRRVI